MVDICVNNRVMIIGNPIHYSGTHPPYGIIADVKYIHRNVSYDDYVLQVIEYGMDHDYIHGVRGGIEYSQYDVILMPHEFEKYTDIEDIKKNNLLNKFLMRIDQCAIYDLLRHDLITRSEAMIHGKLSK